MLNDIMRDRILVDPMQNIDARLEKFMTNERYTSLAPFKEICAKLEVLIMRNIISPIHASIRYNQHIFDEGN